MAEYYDHYHRWEPLAEFYFMIEDDEKLKDKDDNYFYCLCSRAFIRDNIKTYYVEKDASESDVEVAKESQEWENQSHVHFSVDTSYKVKCEKDEGASCYGSATHTDNYCSTDEHDAQFHACTSHVLQPSDSGADLTYQDYHSETLDRPEKMDQDLPSQECNENYLTECTWEKFWAINGERLIWASWIAKYSDYINPTFLDDNQQLCMDENNIPKEQPVDTFENYDMVKINTDDSIRERKYSYDSKVNPYKKKNADRNKLSRQEMGNEMTSNKEDGFQPIGRRRSCSEHERMISPRTVDGTDSMTNVTKITLSSYDITSSHVTSESTPTDDYSVSSTASDEQSNDQTRISNVEENIDNVSVEEMDTEQYWQFLWKKHFSEQYALHYSNYLERNDAQSRVTTTIPMINVEVISDKKIEDIAPEIEGENSEGNSQEMPTVIEVQEKVNEMKIEEKISKPRRKNKKASNKYIDSVGVLLQSLLKEEQQKNETVEVTEAGDNDQDKSDSISVDVTDSVGTSNNPMPLQETMLHSISPYNDDDGDDEPPDDRPFSLKRSHEYDEEEAPSERIQSTFDIMGFLHNSDKMPKGHLVYKKRHYRLRPPRYKKFGSSKKTYFDDDGNAYQSDQAQDSQDDKDNQTDEDCAEVKEDSAEGKEDSSEEKDNEEESAEVKSETVALTDTSRLENVGGIEEKTREAADVPLPVKVDASFSDTADNNEECNKMEDSGLEGIVSTKRRRRPKRRHDIDDSGNTGLPEELRGDTKLLKYWKKRHSLFHRFDEGIKLDRESWFSVTPENVAWHIANKYTYDTVLDAFCGAGGNTIQFARTSKKVIAIDIDPAKIEMAKHNATVYGVADRIEFIVGDFFELAPKLGANMVFLSPPWGGPKYSQNHEYDIETMLEPRPASELVATARTINHNIALYLPRNTRTDQILALAKDVGGSVEIEQSFLDKRFVAITAYYY